MNGPGFDLGPKIPYPPPPSSRDMGPVTRKEPMPIPYSPPLNKTTDTCENITFPQLRWRYLISALQVIINYKIEIYRRCLIWLTS